jgi:hypothetical protein
MLQNLSKEIRECYRRAEQCKRLAGAAMTPEAKADFLDMECRWLSLAHSYEFAERLSTFTEPFRRGARKKKRRVYQPRIVGGKVMLPADVYRAKESSH